MILSRRAFLNLCTSSAAALGLSASDVLKLQELLANPSAPTVLWLQGSGCTGCSVSFLNYFSPATALSPATSAADILVSSVNLAYQSTVMAAYGQTAVNAANIAYEAGGYVLVVEGGIPSAFGGKACLAWTDNGRDVTVKEAVTTLSSRAAAVVCVGTCASYGGVSAALPNLSGVSGVQNVIGKNTFNIPGCPPHPDWIVWAIVKILTNQRVEFDDYRRPKELFAVTVHDRCPRKESRDASTYGQDYSCLEELGCAGPKTRGNCPTLRWNNHVNWCVDANSQCIGCTEPTFPMAGVRSMHELGGD